MKRLAGYEIALVVNALREKAAGDREAIEGSGPIAATLEAQARLADELVEQLENARNVTVEQ